jgi:outer membrane protein TolC
MYGIQRNFRIRDATFASRSAKAGIETAKAQFDPNFTGSVRTDTADGRTWSQAAGSGGVSKKFITGTEVEFQAGQVATSTGDFRNDYVNSTTSEYTLTVRQQLLRGLDPRANRAGIRIAELLRDQAEATRNAEILEMLRASESGYFAAAVAALSEKNFLASLRRAQSVLEDAKARHAAGAASKLDVLEAEVLVSTAQERRLAASKLVSDRVDELWFAIGAPQGVSAARLVFEPINEASMPSADPNPAVSIQRALVNAPTAVLLINEIERREVELRRARNNMLPKLEVEFSGASNKTGSDGSGGRGWEGVALARISLPWTFRAERAQLETAKSELARSEVLREQAEQRLRQRISELCRAVAFGRQQLAAARQSQKASMEKWQEQLQQHREGLVPVRLLREAEEDLRTSEMRVLDARLAILGAWSTLGQLDGTIAQRHNLTF